MTPNSSQRLFMSVFAAGYQHLAQRGREFIAALEHREFVLNMPFEHTSYDIIEREIDDADGLVALVDDYWSSSCWKASEVTYALLGDGALHHVPDHCPVPVFIFWLDKECRLAFLHEYPKPIYLPLDIQEAAEVVKQYFERR
jgi:hypothetical protein